VAKFVNVAVPVPFALPVTISKLVVEPALVEAKVTALPSSE
jgi:hypothetical protein